MALYLVTEQPAALLTAFKRAIAAGSVETWECDNSGRFTHTPAQWHLRAWMKPSVDKGRLAFYIAPGVNYHLNEMTYAVYHGRLLEAFIEHMGNEFSHGCATAKLVAPHE